jgi:hypothetical protein
MSHRETGAAFAAVLALCGCASPAIGPTIAVMPAPTKSFEVFRLDQRQCMEHATAQGDMVQAGMVQGGMAQEDMVEGGAANGANPARQARVSSQERYDIAYAQCMSSRGNRVPGFAPADPRPPPPAR